MLVVATMGAIMLGAIFWGLGKEVQRIRAIRRRFLGRNRVAVDEILNNLLTDSGLDRDSVFKVWNTASGILRIDPCLLRPEDRFDCELKEMCSSEVDGEIDELFEYFSDLAEERGCCFTILRSSTLGDLVREFSSRPAQASAC